MAKKKAKKATNTENRPVGRPKVLEQPLTDFDKLNIALRLAKSGKTIDEISYILNIDRSNFYRYQSENKEFRDALKDWKSHADDEIERSLFERGRGYSCKETKIFFDKESGTCIEHDMIKHYPPDTAAAFIWLKNRRPKDWRDRHEIDLKALGELSDEDLEKMVRKILGEKK